MGERPGQRSLEGAFVPPRDQRAERGVGEHLGVTADIGADHRQPAGHGLEKDVGPALVLGGMREHIGGPVVPAQRIGRLGSAQAHRIAQAERAWLRLDEFVLFVIRVETDLGSPIKPEEWSDLVTSWAVGYGVDHTVGELAANRQRAALKVAREAALALNVNPAEPGTARLAADLAGGGQ